MKNWLPTNIGLLFIVIGVMAMSAVKGNAQGGYTQSTTLRYYKHGPPVKIVPDGRYDIAVPNSNCGHLQIQYSIIASNAPQLPVASEAQNFSPTVAGSYAITIRKTSIMSGDCSAFGFVPPPHVMAEYTINITVVDDFTKQGAVATVYCPPVTTVLNMRDHVSTTDGVTFSSDIGPYASLYPNGSINLANLSNGSHVIYATKAYDNGPKKLSWSIIIGSITSITTQPLGGTICPKKPHALSVSTIGANLSYQWQKDGTNVGGNARTYTITKATANDAGNYTVTVTGACGPSVTSAPPATLTVYDPLVISQQPLGNALCPGGTHTFSVTAGGPPPLGATALQYQWQKNGNSLGSNGRTSAYTITGATANDAGNYTVKVTGVCGPDTSAVATFTVNAPVTISVPPLAGAVCPGNAYEFRVTAGGTPPLGAAALQYQWQKSGSNVGVNARTYTITGATANHAGNYRVTVTGVCGSLTSDFVTLTANAPVTISVPPVGNTICAGGTHEFRVTAGGTPPLAGGALSYQWQRNGNDVAGGNARTYTITSASAAASGNYTVTVTGACGPLAAAARLTVDEPISISSQPRSATVCKGALFTAAVIANGTDPTYQWLKDGEPSPLAGEINSTISITPVTENSVGNYRCIVSGGGVCVPPAPGSQVSEAATLTVYPDLAITKNPEALTACEGRNYSINVVAAGGGNLSYKWYQDDAIIVGRTAATLNLNNVRAADIGRYKAKVSDACGGLDSQEAIVELGASAGITTHPIALQEICRGADYTASVVVTGTAPFTYLWRKDRQAIAGANANPLVITNVNDANVGIYTVEVQGYCGSPAVSTGAQLSLVRNITITTPPPSRTICLNTTYTVSVAVEGDGPTYQWLKGAVPIPGATTDTHTINSATNADAGSYAVMVTGRCNHPTSEPSVLTIVPRMASDAIAFSSPVQNNVLTVCTNSAPVTISNLVTPQRGTFSNVAGLPNVVGLQKNGDQYIFTPAQNNYTAADAPLRLEYHVNIGGCESYKVLSVYVKDNRSVPAIANMPSSVCPGPNVRVTLNGTTSVNADAAPYSYEFLSATGNLLSNANSYSLTVNSDQEEIRIRNINSFGCRSEIVSYTITTPFGSGNITANKTVINVGESIKFGFSGPSSATFDWSFGDGLKGSIQSPRHYYFAQGDYTVTLEAASGECKKTFTLPIRVNGGANASGSGNGGGNDDEPVVITGDRNEKDSIYPNPVKDILYFKGNATFGKKEIEVYSLDGRLYRLAMNSSNSVDVSSLASGVYALKMGEKYVKFIKF